MSSKTDLFKDVLSDNSIVIAPEQGELLETHGMSINLKLTSENTQDKMGVYEITLAPKTIGAKLHYHRFMDETFIVKEGNVTMSLGKEEYIARNGTIAYVPRFTPHGFRNDSGKQAKLILIFNPAQKREGFFKGLHEVLSEQPVDPDKFLKLYHMYDSFPVDTNDMIQSF